jgi:riboflavin kinase
MGKNPSDRTRVLKELAMLGAVNGAVMLSSGELARRLGISQQSASGKILDLVKEELLTRRMGTRKQALQLTPKAVALLRKEHSDYTRLFEGTGKLTIAGHVTSGFGEGGYYVGQGAYQEQFRQKLGIKPFPGTLNLRLSGPEMAKLEVLKMQPGIALEGFTQTGRTFGTGKCFKARLGTMECAVVIPNRSHHADMVEIICERHLRKALGLKDGDSLKLEVQL